MSLLCSCSFSNNNNTQMSSLMSGNSDFNLFYFDYSEPVLCYTALPNIKLKDIQSYTTTHPFIYKTYSLLHYVNSRICLASVPRVYILFESSHAHPDPKQTRPTANKVCIHFECLFSLTGWKMGGVFL